MKDKITDKMIEEKLARAIDESAPDMLDSLMSELGITDESPEMLRDAVLASDAETSGKETEDKDAKTITNHVMNILSHQGNAEGHGKPDGAHSSVLLRNRAGLRNERSRYWAQ